MIKKFTVFYVMLISFYMSASLANPALDQQRLKIVKAYLQNLNDKNATQMVSLFVPNATVLSTSKGEVPAASFFNQFLPQLSQSKVSHRQIYRSLTDGNHMGAKFHLSYTMSDGERGEGNYMDDFSFVPNTYQLKHVAMFENLKK